MAIVGAEGGDSSDVQSAIAPTQSTPPPPAAGQESGVFAQVSQVAQQAAQQTAQTAQAATQQAVAQQPKLATLPKGQKVAPVPTSPIPEFDFNHDSFDPTLFNQRFTDVVNQFKDKVGTTPSLSVAHDLTRSGLNLDAVSDIAQHILSSQHDMNGSYTVDVHGLPADWKNVINGDELAQLHSKPIVAVQNAPWQGLKWDGEKFLANLNESAPAQFLKREIQKSLQTPEEALALINEIRKSNPAAVARAMGDIARGDFTEALAKVKEQLGDAFNTAFRLPAAQAAQDVATSVSAAHAVAVKTSLGIAKLAGETGFLKMDDNGNIVLGASQGSRIGQDILSIEGKSVSGANVTLTPQAYDQIKKLAAANGAKPESVAWLDPNSPENRNPEGWRRALSVVDMGSLAFAPTLASSLLSGSVENGLLENGVDKRVAHTAGAIVSFLGVGTLPKNLNMLGKIGAVGGGIAGGAQAALTSGGEKDPFMRGEDIATGAAQGVLGGGQLGHHIGVWRVQSSLTHQILSTLRHDDVQAVKNGLKSKLEVQSEQGKALQAEADVHLSRVNDAALKLQELEKKSSTKPQGEAPQSAPEVKPRAGDDIQKKYQPEIDKANATGDVVKATRLQQKAYEEMSATPEPGATPGTVRMYRGYNSESHNIPAASGKAWFTPSRRFAEDNYTGADRSGQVKYTDVPKAEYDAARASEYNNREIELDQKYADQGTPVEAAQAQAAQAQEKIQELNRTQEHGEPMAKAVDDYHAAVGKLSDLSTPPDPELAKARQAYVDASAAHALAQGRADVLRERVRRQIEGNVDSPVRQASEGLLHVLDREIPKHATEFGGVALVQATRVMAQEVGNAVKNVFKEIGDTPANHAQLRAAMENHDFIDQITNPKLQQLARDLHALNAGIAARIPESLKVEIIQDYYPRGAGLSRERFERTVRSDNPLPVSTSHLHNRVVPEDEAEVNKAHPGDEYEAYTASMGQALVNHRVRAAVRDAKTGDGKPVFVSFESTTDRVPPDNGLKYTKSTLAGLEGWLETGTHDHLKAMATPVAKDGLGKLYSNFNSYYKTLAMTSLQHFWNQFSAAIGVDPGGNIGSLLKRGQSITHDPRAFAAALEHVYAQPERFIAEVADNMTTNAPHLTPALDALRSVEKQTFGRFEHTLWTSSIRNVQFGIYDTLRAKLRAQHGDAYTPEEYDHAAGYMAGQIVGIMPPQKLAVWERQLQKYLAFAYQWNRKHVTIVGQALPVFGEGRAKAFDPTLNDKTAHLVTEMSRDYLTRYAVTAMAYLYAGQVVLNGTFPSDNKPGHEFDFNWTRLHDMVYGADGQDHYITFPPLMFGNFFHSKVQVMQDALERAGTNTGEGVVKGLANNLANITMPIPSWFIQTFTNLGTEDASGMIGRAYQTSNPFQRNFFGPLAKNEPPKDATDLLGDLGSFFGGFSGLKVSQGAHRPFSPSKIVNEDRRAAALTLARMGIDPALASDADWARAEKELHSGEFLGVNLKQVGEAIAGHPEGTGSAYKAMNQWADQTMNSALIEAGLTQAQIDKAKADGGQPIHLLTPSQERKMFEEHPELQYILNAPPVSDDPAVIKAHADMTKYNSALSYTYSKTADRQKALDAEYESGKISLTEWKSRTHDIRQQEKGAIDDAWHLLTPDEQFKLSRSPEEKGKTDPVIANSPLLAAEQAYWGFRQIASTGNYDQPDGTISPDLRKAQNAYMAGLSADMQQYILNREAQTQTPLQQKYYAAADKYGQFKDQNAQWEEIRSAYDSMPKFQRDLLKETYPDFSKYMTYRENYFKENQDVADFYHLTDFKAYQQKPKLVQAMDVADYFVTHYGKHPEFNSPWADSVVTDPNVWAQVTAGWDQATYNQFLGAYQGYYQNQADQRAKFHDFLTQLFARRRTVKTSSGTGSVLGG